MHDNPDIPINGRSECRDAAKSLILGALNDISLITQRLESELYDDSDIYEYLSRLAARNRNATIRIIAHDTRPAANRGHRLIHLAQNLPSFAQIRVTRLPDQRRFRESWLIVDQGAYLRMRNLERFEGYYKLDNKLNCRDLRKSFLEFWEACEPDQNTRRLSL